jgi:hypothetical protein
MSEQSEQSEQERPDGEANQAEPTATATQAAASSPLSALKRAPASTRNLSLLTGAFLVIGSIAYFAVPAWSGTSANAADVATGAGAGQSRPAPSATIPGPMPGAPTQKPTLPPPPTGGPRPFPVRPTPIALQPSNPRLVKTWNSGPGGRALAAVTELSSNALFERSTGQYALMLLDCKALSTAVSKALLAPFIPDLPMQVKYLTTLTSFQLAAVECVTAIHEVPDGVEDTVTNVNPTVMDLAASGLSTGASDLYVATEMLRRR